MAFSFDYYVTKHVILVMSLWLTMSLVSVPNLVLATKDGGATPCNFPAIFNFGDSNSDTGGLSTLFGQFPPPNGESFFHAPAGRLSDGRLIIDFIAKSMELPYLSPYLDVVGANFLHGANFATAGSPVRAPIVTFQQSGYSPISLDVQFTQFKDFRRRSNIIRSQGGISKKLLPKTKSFQEGLYTIDIGQNDMTLGYALNMTTDQVKAYIPDVVDQFTTAVKGLYNEGGRSFRIHNTGPAGCIPYVLTTFAKPGQEDEVGCAKPYNEVAQYYNLKLKEAVNKLREDLPLAAITYVDVYSVKYELISHAEKYGFKNPLKACCGYGGEYNFNSTVTCGKKVEVNGEEVVLANSCKDPSTMINWDGIHYTQAANNWIFDQIVNGSFSDPPVPLNMSCYRNVNHMAY